MIRVSQTLALILAIIFQYVFKINRAFHFLNITFVFVLLFIVLKFTVTNIGLCFEFNQHCHKQTPYLYCLNTVIVVNVVVCGYFLHLLLLQHGDIESNPGPRNEQINKSLSCCHWNVNSFLAHNLAKISEIEAYNSLFNHNFIWISETYFDSSVLEGDRSFQLFGYDLLRADPPSNAKRGGVCTCYKESLVVREVKLNVSFVKFP